MHLKKNPMIVVIVAAAIFVTVMVAAWRSALVITRNGSPKMADSGFTPAVEDDEVTYNGTKSRSRVLCWILTGPENHMKKAIHVKRTWGSRCDKLLFMSSEKDGRLGSIALEGVEEGHGKLWPKTQKAFQYIWQHHRDEADWILKADDDTYVLTDNLRNFLKNYSPAEAHYFGYVSEYGKGIPMINFGGAGYILSKEATRLLVEVAFVQGGDCHREIRKLHKGDEDTELGVCLASVGVKAEITFDENHRQRFNFGNPFSDMENMADDYLKRWNNGSVWSSESTISFHNVNPYQMYMLEYLTHKLKSSNNSK